MIDLQLHTTDSDGTWPWKKVLEACAEMKLAAFAITDHDTAIRREEILAWAKEKKVLAIPGIELSTRENDQTVHLLGYFIDGPLHKLNERLDYLKHGRLDRNKKIVARLQKLGISITEDEVIQLAGTGIIGRPHIARLLLEKNIVSSIHEAFDKYLSLTGQAYYPKDELPLREGIELLRSAGAVTSVAHPGLLKRTPEELEASLKIWKSWGLDGIEAIYPVYNIEQTAFFHRMSEKYDLIRTGGSDFHGENKPHIKIGTGLGNLNVPDSLIEPLLKKRDELLTELGVSLS